MEDVREQKTAEDRFWGANHKTHSRFRAVMIAVLAVIFVFAGYVTWKGFLSKEAREERRVTENAEQANAALKEFEEQLKNDTYGGKTPEETLALFIDALKKKDFDLASKYFALNGQLTRDQWKENIQEREKEIINIITKAKPVEGQKSSNSNFWFSITDAKGEIEQLIQITFNQRSGVWKIESL